ncbi:MAG: hypothetical protein ACLQU3_12025 [Limisphaerales bacterium]
MNTLKSICLSLLVVMGVSAGASAQPSATNINPALLYYQAFLVAPDLSQADNDYLWTKEWQGQELPERYGKLMAGYDNEFRLVRQAARSTVPCDWGIDMSAGPAILLPHLGRAKAVALAARFRVYWALQHGRQADAREDLIAAFVLARNASRDGSLIATLVQQAAEVINCATVAEVFGQFSPEDLQQLLEGIDGPPARRMVAECVAAQPAFCNDWMLHRIQALQQANPGDEAKVMAGIREMFAGMLEPQEERGNTSVAQGSMAPGDNSQPGEGWDRLARAAGGTSDGVVRLIRELEAFGQRLAPVLTLPHGEYEAPMAQLKAEVQASANPLLALSFPVWERARPRELRAEMTLAMVRAAIGYKLQGPVGLQSVTDPWGQGPFEFQRFVFQGVDRGFELKSACRANGWPEVLIFVEKEGPPFYVNGRNAGQARPATYPK